MTKMMYKRVSRRWEDTIMAMPQNFRGAFNGFNREDVVNYISYMTSKHETQVNQLRAEMEALEEKLAARDLAENAVETVLSEKAQLERQLQALQKQKDEETDVLRRELETEKEQNLAMGKRLEELEAACARANGELAEANTAAEELRRELENAKKPASQSRTADSAGRWTEELNAYRRAESAERRARERVNQMYDRANGALAEASLRVEHTAAQVAELVVKVESDLELLRRAIGDSENTLADTAVMLGAIRPEMD